MTIAAYDDTLHRDSVITLWQNVFGYSDKRNDPALTLDKKLAVDDKIFVAVEDGMVAGTIMAGYDGHRGWIYSLAVIPGHRNRGIATELLRHAEQLLAKAGCMKINLQVLESNSAVTDFYRKNGYTVEQRISMGKQITGNIPE